MIKNFLVKSTFDEGGCPFRNDEALAELDIWD